MDGSSSRDDVKVTYYSWTWGNGRAEGHYGSSATNSWAAAGTYNVTLTVQDAGGLTNSITKVVVVP
jgi:PKD repeat protein